MACWHTKIHANHLGRCFHLTLAEKRNEEQRSAANVPGCERMPDIIRQHKIESRFRSVIRVHVFIVWFVVSGASAAINCRKYASFKCSLSFGTIAHSLACNSLRTQYFSLSSSSPEKTHTYKQKNYEWNFLFFIFSLWFGDICWVGLVRMGTHDCDSFFNIFQRDKKKSLSAHEFSVLFLNYLCVAHISPYSQWAECTKNVRQADIVCSMQGSSLRGQKKKKNIEYRYF